MFFLGWLFVRGTEVLRSYKANTASVETIVVDDDTGEEKKRLINRMRWKGFGPISISYTEKNVSKCLVALSLHPVDML